ncbi:histidine phosphatase family protein [Niallia sp. JL1B1071]|uniref:histidine phosphatase family protein n=1 Tax=Niallia tiangongensis TaxID=3237105 RepID=UPI0037DC130F
MNTSKTIYLIRHCEAYGQQAEAPLTASGKRQANDLANFLKEEGIQLILSSTSLRAYESAKPLAERLQIPIQNEERLIERKLSSRNLNNWQSLLEQSFTDLEIAYEGGESSRQAMTRATDIMKECLQRQENRFAMVTHGNLLALMWKYVDPSVGFIEWSKLSNPDVIQINYHSDRVSVKRIWGDND